MPAGYCTTYNQFEALREISGTRGRDKGFDVMNVDQCGVEKLDFTRIIRGWIEKLLSASQYLQLTAMVRPPLSLHDLHSLTPRKSHPSGALKPLRPPHLQTKSPANPNSPKKTTSPPPPNPRSSKPSPSSPPPPHPPKNTASSPPPPSAAPLPPLASPPPPLLNSRNSSPPLTLPILVQSATNTS